MELIACLSQALWGLTDALLSVIEFVQHLWAGEVRCHKAHRVSLGRPEESFPFVCPSFQGQLCFPHSDPCMMGLLLKAGASPSEKEKSTESLFTLLCRGMFWSTSAALLSHQLFHCSLCPPCMLFFSLTANAGTWSKTMMSEPGKSRNLCQPSVVQLHCLCLNFQKILDPSKPCCKSQEE